MTRQIHTHGSKYNSFLLDLDSTNSRQRYYKSVVYPYGQWTITDASLSPDNRFLAYSSIRSIVCLAPTDPDNDSEPTLLDFANTGTHNHRGFHTYFGVRRHF
jgi:WD repeat-containing protein 23